jgi:hypothetical protein
MPAVQLGPLAECIGKQSRDPPRLPLRNGLTRDVYEDADDRQRVIGEARSASTARG